MPKNLQNEALVVGRRKPDRGNSTRPMSDAAVLEFSFMVSSCALEDDTTSLSGPWREPEEF
jgi:hypothetical protein